MPYPGVSKNKTKKLERCVERVISGSDFKKKYKDKKDKKSIAIAICRKAMNI